MNFLLWFHCVRGNLSVVPILQLLNGFNWEWHQERGGGGWIGWASTLIVCPTRASVWQTSVFYLAAACLTKFQGVPCQEVGGATASSAAYLIAMYAVAECNRNQRLRSTREVSIERDKRVGWLWRSLSKSLFHTAFISPNSTTPDEHLNFFPNNFWQINRSLVILLLSWFFR